MLKKEYDIVHISFKNWLFNLKAKDIQYRAFGLNLVNSTDLMLSSEFLKYIQNLNKTVNPNASLIIPKSMCWGDFNRIISNIKNQIL